MLPTPSHELLGAVEAIDVGDDGGALLLGEVILGGDGVDEGADGVAVDAELEHGVNDAAELGPERDLLGGLVLVGLAQAEGEAGGEEREAPEEPGGRRRGGPRVRRGRRGLGLGRAARARARGARRRRRRIAHHGLLLGHARRECVAPERRVAPHRVRLDRRLEVLAVGRRGSTTTRAPGSGRRAVFFWFFGRRRHRVAASMIRRRVGSVRRRLGAVEGLGEHHGREDGVDVGARHAAVEDRQSEAGEEGEGRADVDHARAPPVERAHEVPRAVGALQQVGDLGRRGVEHLELEGERRRDPRRLRLRRSSVLLLWVLWTRGGAVAPARLAHRRVVVVVVVVAARPP
mmetsp:Transcript_3698/g.14489  ORF Transcript_3698/g.14489 Transcript_3698/m.14489 type:complete len:346 (+) Transcript_3698:47-1084(+)